VADDWNGGGEVSGGDGGARERGINSVGGSETLTDGIYTLIRWAVLGSKLVVYFPRRAL